MTKKPYLSTRDGFSNGLVEAARGNKDIVVLTGDLTDSVKVRLFEKMYPERFIQVGIAEQNMIGIAAGLALSGKIPFAASYAVFSPGRSWDQIRVSVCFQQANVKIVGTHAGLNVGPDGSTAQALEDIAMMRSLPHMTVIVPCDAEQARLATLAAAKHKGPVYLRLTREPSPEISITEPFEIGKAQVLTRGRDITIVACGPILDEALKAAAELEKDGILVEVINMHTIKPLDTGTLETSVRKTKHVVTVEEHQIYGGLGSAVAEALSQTYPVPVEMIAVKDTFGESGKAQELLEKYGLTHPHIVRAVHACLKR